MEALTLGSSLAQFSGLPRILYCTKDVLEDGAGDMLHAVWDVRTITHLTTNEIAQRLNRTEEDVRNWCKLEKNWQTNKYILHTQINIELCK